MEKDDRRGGVAMVTEDDRTDRAPRSRFDLAAKLFRPQWNRFRGVRPSTLAAGATRQTATSAEGVLAQEHPIDVICGGMYRACSTWQYEVVAHLIEHHFGGQRLGYMTSDQYQAHLRARTSDSAHDSQPTAGWRVVKSHDRDRSFARAMAEQKAVAVYAYRDVREVVFSLMHKRGMTFEQLLRQGMIHQILANDRFWMAQPDVLAQRYEDLLTEPARGVGELARHLGIRLEASEADRIAVEYSHESNRARTDALRRRLAEAGVNLDSAANAQICDSTTLLHWNHIRQGDSKCWHALANSRQRMVLARLCGRWLKARGYTLDPNENRPSEVTIRERISIEVDMIVARATFELRSASQRFPRAARALKRLLGLPVDTQAGATAWADATPSPPRVRRTGEPHIALTAKPVRPEQDLVATETRTSPG
jgi:hypothetical protein